MKICATSDLHGFLPEIKPCELVLICGDIMPLRMQRNIPQSEKWLKTTFADWVKSLPCEAVVMVGGNHDWVLFNMYQDFLKQNALLRTPTNGKLVLLENTIYKHISSEGKIYTIWGTPFCKPFGNWAFMYEPETLIKAYETMPEYCDIVLSHDCYVDLVKYIKAHRKELMLEIPGWQMKCFENIPNIHFADIFIVESMNYNS